MDSDLILGWLIIIAVLSTLFTSLYIIPKHDEDGWEVKNATCTHVLKDALDHTYAICNTNTECNIICEEQRNKR